MLTMEPCTDYRFSGVLVMWKIVGDFRYNINNSVTFSSFIELRALISHRRKTFNPNPGSGVALATSST